PTEDREQVAGQRPHSWMIAEARMNALAERDRRKAADADRDPVGHAIAGAAFERVAEAVPEVEQEPLVAVELVDFDEPFLGTKAELDHPLEVPVRQRNIVVEALVAPREADLRRLAASCRDMLRWQRLDRGDGHDNLAGRMEGAGQILEWSDVDRAFAAEAAVDHREQRRRQQGPP